MNEPTHLDLFSGIGGFALAAQWAGFRTIGFCEIDKYCQKVLAQNFMADTTSGNNEHFAIRQAKFNDGRPIIHENIFDLDGRDFAGVDLITGGFPCQPFSVAGKRRGAEDDRHLWPEMLRVIDEARPAWVLGENVPGIIPMELDNVLSDLEGIGYATRTFVVPACAVDARHRRDRVWIVGRLVADTASQSTNGHASRTGAKYSVPRVRSEYQWGKWKSEPDVGGMANGLSKKLDGGLNEQMDSAKKPTTEYFTEWQNLRTLWFECESAKASSELRLRKMLNFMSSMPCAYGPIRWNQESEKDEEVLNMLQRLSSSSFQKAQHLFPVLLERIGTNQREQEVASWAEEPNVGRVTIGVKNRVDRLKGLGNAIVPQVAYQILKEIRKLI